MKNDAVKISIESGEGTLVSNQDGIEFVHSEFIRDQMVKLNSDSEVELNITENDQYSNSNTLSLSFVINQMIISKNPQFTGISARQQLEFTTHLLLTD